MDKMKKYVSIRRIVAMLTVMAVVVSGSMPAFAMEQPNGYVPKLGFAVNSKDVMQFQTSATETKPVLVKSAVQVMNIDGVTYVPVRAFGDALGYEITFIKAANTVGISFQGKTQQFLAISKFDDIKNEMAYFSINGNSYVKAESFAKLGGLKIVEKEGAYLYYGLTSTGQNVNSAGQEISSATTESGVNATSGDGTSTPQRVQTVTNGAVSPDSTVVMPELSDMFQIQGETITLMDGFLKVMKQNVVAPTENYVSKIKRSYDGVYYKPFVNPYVKYSYEQMLLDIKKLSQQYPEYIKTGVAGKSVEGRDLASVAFGNGPKHIYVLGSHHAREYISTSYIMKFINETAYAAKTGINYTAFDIRKILANVTFHIMPMVNPDGVNLVQNGIESVSAPYREQVRAMPFVDGSDRYRSWKSNIRGVDINRNYPNNWGQTKTRYSNSSSMYQGPSPASEPETQAVMRYLNMYKAESIVSVHSQGELIYWSNPEQQLGTMGQRIIASSGFRPIMNTCASAKAGFLSNYARDTCKSYEITIELCKYIGPYSYPDAQFDEVWAPRKIFYLS